MPDENPYRYEGTAESLNSATVVAPGTFGICFKSFLVTLVTSIVAGNFLDAEAIGLAVLFAFPLLLPITAFGMVFRKTHQIGKSQFAYWGAATPLAIFFGFLITSHDPEQNIAWIIGVSALTGYVFLLVPTSLALIFFAARSKLTPVG